jgi:2-keto-4-pentenoate hydratase
MVTYPKGLNRMDRIGNTVNCLLAMRAERRVVASLEASPSSLDEAYRAQELLVRELLARSDGHVAGYKVAATHTAAQRLLQVDSPFFGLLLSGTSFTSPATLPSDEFTVRCIEAEFGVVMGDTPSGERDYTQESIAEFISAVIPCIEVVDHRFADWGAVGAPTLIADNAIHGAWIEGKPVTHWRGTDMAEHRVELFVNGRLVSTGSGAAVLGNPLNVVAWLANELPRYGRHLKRGDKVTTGTAAPVYFANPGDHVIANFGTFGQAELNWSE